MECSIIHCKKTATEFYRIREARFGYCKKHTTTPEKIRKNVRGGFYGVNRGFVKLMV